VVFFLSAVLFHFALIAVLFVLITTMVLQGCLASPYLWVFAKVLLVALSELVLRGSLCGYCTLWVTRGVV